MSSKRFHRFERKSQPLSTEMNMNDEFHKDGKLADATFVVENHKILVSKAVLSVASPVFCAMFEGDFREKTETEIPLPGKNYEDFVEFLRCIYPDKMKEISVRNVYMILPLAHEYNIERMMKRCQNVLMRIVRKSYKENVDELYRHIQFSEMYSLEELKEKCIYLASEHTLKQFKTAREKYQITDASHDKIIKLALRRHELNKADDKVFTARAKLHLYSSLDAVQCDFNGKLITDGRKASDVCQALRVIERFKFTTDNSNIKSNLLEKLQIFYDREEDMEEFDLLPENVKAAIQHS